MIDTNCYIKSVRFNGKPYDKAYFTHADIAKGGVIEYEMASKPNKSRCQAPDTKPYSLSDAES